MDDSIASARRDTRPNPFFRAEEHQALLDREAAQDLAENRELKIAWDELREKLAARMQFKLPLGQRGRGNALVLLEDADSFVTQFLGYTE